MSHIDQDLVGALKQAKTKPMHFALVLKAPGEGTLIVSKNRIAPKAIAEAKRDLGGGQVLQGRCVGDAAGELMFETAKEPPANLAKTLKAVISRDAGLTLKVAAKKGADLSEEDENGADTSAAGPAQTDNGAPVLDKDAIRKRLAALAAQYSKILKGPLANGSEAASLRTQLDTTKSLIDKQDWPGASKSLDEMERLIARANAGEVIYQVGYEDGSDKFSIPQPNRRPVLAKRQEFAALLHYYDEGYQAGSSDASKARDFQPNSGPTMGPNTMTKDEEERGKEIEESRKELKRVLSGQDDDMPHNDPEEPRVEWDVAE